MRLWTIHPCYLDSKGLVAAWREGLLAQKVLEGKTKGYKHHPQLIRFLKTQNPLAHIGCYLFDLVIEANKRRYRFDESKIKMPCKQGKSSIGVNSEQIEYEFSLLKTKIKERDSVKYEEICTESIIKLNRAFTKRKGSIEEWERPIPEVVKQMNA